MKCANEVLTELFQHGIAAKEAIEISISLNKYKHPSLIRNTILAIKQHLDFNYLESYISSNKELLNSDNYKGEFLEEIDYAKALYLQEKIQHLDYSDSKCLSETVLLCEGLNEVGYYHPSFQLIYHLRDNPGFKDYAWLIPWVKNIVTKIERNNIQHRLDMKDAIDKIFMEYGVINVFHGDKKLGRKYLEKSAKNYPDARNALMFSEMI